MALSVKNPEADQLARKLSGVTGLSLTDAVLKALREQLIRETGNRFCPRPCQRSARDQQPVLIPS